MKRRWFYCQPCSHKHWWQHRNPNPGVRLVGFAAMVLGVVMAAAGLTELGVL